MVEWWFVCVSVRLCCIGTLHTFSDNNKCDPEFVSIWWQDEPFTFESSETQKEEVLMTGSLQKMHAQLRRLRNDSSILKDAYITAIPNHKSKVSNLRRPECEGYLVIVLVVLLL